MTLEKQVSQKEKQLLEASKKRDVSVLKELLHDDLLFSLPSGQVITKQTDIDAYLSGEICLDKIDLSEELITVMEDVAIVTFKVLLKGRYHEDIFDGYFRFLRIWKQFDNDWKIIGGSSVAIKEV